MDEESSNSSLYFFPEDEVTRAELEVLLSGDDRSAKCWAVSHLLRYAQWEDIWTYVSREEVRELFPDLDLPGNLRQAWAGMLGVEASVS